MNFVWRRTYAVFPQRDVTASDGDFYQKDFFFPFDGFIVYGQYYKDQSKKTYMKGKYINILDIL